MIEDYSEGELAELEEFYLTRLAEDTLPFWLKDGIDKEHGGYLLMRDADGSLLDDDKAVWVQGRFATILATLYNEHEPREEWLTGAQTGVDFLKKHCFDVDGQMFFQMTRDGKPLRKRRYYFSEAFAISAYAQLAKACVDEELAQEARDLFRRCMRYWKGELALDPKFTDVRKSKGIGVPMIFLNVAQQLVETVGCSYAESCIDEFINEMRLFVKDDIRCVLEILSEEGEVIDHIHERTCNPGHAIEGAWFILYEARRRGGDGDLEQLGLSMLDYMWERGWDEEFGGIIYYVDVNGRPVQEYWQDMKFWWPQCEAIIATLMAYDLTGDPKYAKWHRQIHDYAHTHFADTEHGEWFGYLHRDGTVANRAKGNNFKGPFHLPRMQWMCYRILKERRLSNLSKVKPDRSR